MKANAEPGVFADLPFGDYLKIDAISTSQVNQLDNTLLHWKHDLESPSKVSDALKLGSAFDLAIEDFARFKKEFAVLPADLNLRTKAGREERDSMFAEFGESNVLSEEQFRQVWAMVQAVERCPQTKRIVDSVYLRQLSIVWRCPETGLSRKARLDAMAKADGIPGIVDWKTIRVGYIKDSLLSRAIYDRGYHRQGAAYLQACKAHGIEARFFGFVFVESDEPFGVGFRQLDEDSVRVGEIELAERMKKIKYAIDTGSFPGYEPAAEIGIPKWVKDFRLLPEGARRPQTIQEF